MFSKILFLILALSWISLVDANYCHPPRYPWVRSAYDIQYCNGGAYNGYDDPCLLIEADFLYWRPQQSGMSYAVGYEGIVVESDGRAFLQHNKWSPGVRVKLDYWGLRNGFDTSLEWTHLNQNITGSDFAPTILATHILALVEGVGGANGGIASSNWDLNFNMFDLNVGYLMSPSPCFTFRPIIGLKGGRIRQAQTINYDNFLDSTTLARFNAIVKETNNFSGVGPKLGFGINYLWQCGFKFIGDFGGSLLYGRLHAPTTFFIEEPIGTVLNDQQFSYTTDLFIPNANAFFGLSWNTCFCNWFSLSLNIGYEAQYFWSTWRHQNSHSQTVNNTDAGYGNLVMHGLTTGLSIGF